MTDHDMEIELLEESQEEELLDEALTEAPQEEEAACQLPLNFLTFGQIEPDDVKVYIHQRTYKALEKLSASDTTTELGSILIGDFIQEMGKTHVIISDYVEAKYTDASASTLTFTHETWEYVHREHEENYPDKKIIGWQHTHPSYGIFLSNYDMFIQENFFNLPFQVAYVIDPVQKLRGFFQWKDGKVERLNGYYIYDEPGKPIKIDQSTKPQSAAEEKSSTGWIMPAIIALLCVVTVALSVAVFTLNKNCQTLLDNQQTLIDRITLQEATLAGQANTIDALQDQLAQAPDTTLQDTVDALKEELDALKEEFSQQQAQLEELQEEDYIQYTVKPGDTLAKICQAHGLDYFKHIDTILTLNGITDVNMLYVGQSLRLPAHN